MLKVIIADDEDRICQLIRALVDWDSMNLEIVGIAHNGLEALELVKRYHPEILITDIRMPGCNGLELIENVKKAVNDLEIVIISGYAHFEYAQSAIKYGVGDYLLKPINKAELNSTLKKLKERIESRKESEESRLELLEKSEKDIRRLRKNLMERLIEQQEEVLSYESFREVYHLQMKPGLFQAFFLKIDGRKDEISRSGLEIIVEKVQNLLENSLRPRCTELLIGSKGWICAGIMNYEKSRQEEIRRTLRDCLNQLEVQRGLFGPVVFSMSAGSASERPELLMISIREAAVIIQERIVKGTGRLLDRMPSPSAIHEKNLMEKYLRLITHAIEVMSVEEADAAIMQIQHAAEHTKDVSGYEIFELIHSCGSLFLSQVEEKNRAEELKAFDEQCRQCSSTQELFEELKGLQGRYIEDLKQKHDDDTARPIRQAKQYIQKHYNEQITLDQVSDVVGLSTAYFSVLFKKEEGEGFAKYLINVRMEQAKVLLRETNCPVAEVCRRVGYNDLKHFTHTFEKATGVKPATYRKLYG